MQTKRNLPQITRTKVKTPNMCKGFKADIKFKINQILLSTLLYMYDDHTTNKSKHKTFILCACRNFSGNNPAGRLFARTLSGYPNNNTPRNKSNN